MDELHFAVFHVPECRRPPPSPDLGSPSPDPSIPDLTGAPLLRPRHQVRQPPPLPWLCFDPEGARSLALTPAWVGFLSAGPAAPLCRARPSAAGLLCQAGPRPMVRPPQRPSFFSFVGLPVQIRPRVYFFRLCDFAFYPVIYQFCRKTLEPHACNN